MKHGMFLLALFAASVVAHAQQGITADTVLWITPGTGQNAGQAPAFFPHNIFGIPDPRARDTIPSTDPREICSIGLGGEIVIGFKNRAIVDGPGVDFVVFENAFHYGNGRLYAEPARVDVSADGMSWIAFAFDSASLAGCAGVTPTTGNDPFDPSVSGGDGFDLASIGVDTVRWIRLTDVTRIILDDRNHRYYDPTLTGADIDAVVGIHYVDAPSSSSAVVIPRSTTIQLSVAHGTGTYTVHDIAGRLLHREELQQGIHERDVSSLVVTTALVTLATTDGIHTVKVLR